MSPHLLTGHWKGLETVAKALLSEVRTQFQRPEFGPLAANRAWTAEKQRSGNGKLAEDSVVRAQIVLSELGGGEFLPGFEEIEKRATKGRGVAGQIVAEVRAQIDTLRADMAVAVGEALLDRGQAAQAVAILEPIVKRSESASRVWLPTHSPCDAHVQRLQGGYKGC